MDSKVSIIIPTYNRCHLLAETLDSVFAQTFRDYQVIVVDDGSEDATPARVAAYADRLVYHRIAHAGVSAARNAGLALACGDRVAFLDSDDVWERTFLERMVTALDASPEAGFTYCDYATFDAQGIGRAAYLSPYQKLNGNLFPRLLETDFLSTGAIVIRRACLDRVGGFDPALVVAQDWDLWLRLAREFDAAYVDEPLVRIRMDSDGLTRHTLQLHADNLRVLAKWHHRVQSSMQQTIRRNLRTSHRSLAVHYWRAHRPWSALKHRVLALLSKYL